MANQKIITTINVGLSADRKLPGADSQNIGNFKAEITDETPSLSNPKSFTIAASGTKAISFLSAETKYIAIKSDLPLTATFGSNDPLPVDPILVIGGDVIALGSLVLANADTGEIANVEMFEVGA